MKGRKPKPTIVYVVEWPAHGIVKIGVSENRRWTKFVERGGKVLSLESFDKYEMAYHREAELQAVADLHFGRAYNDRSEAAALLGQTGSGYTECFRASGESVMGVLSGR